MVVRTSIGVVGLGKMGGSVAQNFHDEGWTVIGHDIDESNAVAAEQDGIQLATSPKAVADQVAVVVTSLPSPEAVESVYLDQNGILATENTDLIALELSTIGPSTSETISDAAKSVTYLDAPVSGGPEKASDGTLTVMIGGPSDVVKSEQIQAVLDVLGSNSYHLGSVGSGHTTKLLNNQIGAGVRAAFYEAAAVAAVQGVDWDAFMQVVRYSSGSSYEFRKRMPRILNRDFGSGFNLETSKKDVRLALEMAQSVDAPAEVTSVVYEQYKRAMARGYGDEDIIAIIKLLEETTGVPVESDESYPEDYLDWTQI